MVVFVPRSSGLGSWTIMIWRDGLERKCTSCLGWGGGPMYGPLRPDPRIIRRQLQLCRGDHKRPNKKSKKKFQH
ncbi:hypothetical protein NC653_023376 [Populus alba x Populus x berolinensis]|uniref:Uncharacterized protein n=1 Tax=Populus alba x Populus x berolinensis TaxID=444605 RepID=A0AAD6MJH5_9ROSI|nr:hypothetical protein NC653_023376 [Populus alba x Populus x berolinensis]